MDDTDKQIIKLLKEDARAGYGEIGAKVGLSEGAVRKRIKTLSDQGIIRKFTVKIGVAEGAQAITYLQPTLPTQHRKFQRKSKQSQTLKQPMKSAANTTSWRSSAE